jgi:hypothetical protein
VRKRRKVDSDKKIFGIVEIAVQPGGRKIIPNGNRKLPEKTKTDRRHVRVNTTRLLICRKKQILKMINLKQIFM